MSIEMQQLRHLCAVADHGQIAAAARAIAITQPALSRSIRNLEEALGVTLFERSRQGVEPTAYGRAFLEHARAVVSEVRRAQESVDALRGLTRGQVSFGLGTNFDTYLLPAALGTLLSGSPGVSVVCVGGFYEDLAVRVRTGELDFAFVLLPVPHGHPDLTEEEVLPVAYHVYASVDHPLARRRGLTLADIAACNWVMPDQPAMRNFDRYFETAGVTPPRIMVRATSTALQLATVRSCLLLSMLPDHLMEDEVARGNVVALDVHALPEQKQAGLVYRTSAILSPAARALMDTIRAACARRIDRAGSPSAA
jgi:DNA-binding transcriptional LysR family regulator